jgi:hypothetical protein
MPRSCRPSRPGCSRSGPSPVIRFVDIHGNRYYQFRDHTQRFPANTDWTQALTAIDEWLRTGPGA